MNAIRSHHLSRRICLALVFMMLTSILPVGLVTGAFAQQPQPKTVLVFPMTNAVKAEDNAPANLADNATGALTMAVGDVPNLDAVQFSPTSPSVRRAVSEGRVRQVDVEEGARDLGTALTIGAALQVDYIITASVQSFTRKETPASIEVILAGQMYEVAANINPANGEPISDPKVYKAFGVSGASTTRARQTGNEGPMVREALRDAAYKAAQALSGRTEVTNISAGRRGGGGSYKWVLGALLLLGLALAVNNGSGSTSTSAGADPVPVAFVALENNQGTLTLTWPTPTNTTLTVLRFQVFRAVNGGSFSRIDDGTLGPGTTSFNDFNLLAGRNAYQYKVLVVYTNGKVSDATRSATLIVTK